VAWVRAGKQDMLLHACELQAITSTGSVPDQAGRSNQNAIMHACDQRHTGARHLSRALQESCAKLSRCTQESATGKETAP
jgi:hypothetical protein